MPLPRSLPWEATTGDGLTIQILFISEECIWLVTVVKGHIKAESRPQGSPPAPSPCLGPSHSLLEPHQDPDLHSHSCESRK